MKVFLKKIQYKNGMKFLQKSHINTNANMNFKKEDAIQVPISMFKRQYLPNTNNKQLAKGFGIWGLFQIWGPILRPID